MGYLPDEQDIQSNCRKPMMITTTASRPFEKIYMDIAGPLTKSYNGNVFILTLQDDLTKFAWAASNAKP